MLAQDSLHANMSLHLHDILISPSEQDIQTQETIITKIHRAHGHNAQSRTRGPRGQIGVKLGSNRCN